MANGQTSGGLRSATKGLHPCWFVCRSRSPPWISNCFKGVGYERGNQRTDRQTPGGDRVHQHLGPGLGVNTGFVFVT